ncbi:uncharacterized protein LOC9656016 [Selaginella moellendorffii]|uniref:uncharacterized protein LOC9656016 n=1 Tax=Selaginella moellendorffii TaxID=88036 RepID=UPI000D1C5305|nr:uncharacterized protein LOC9656016 [Selaginella moellendorffii]XP_024534556.1 uncharacterized protein LOC9656016 [Selaginella moellendorffii]|eukprot:XP_002973960.2 uncharacterized protein LOC9656016 [Selaginella moellendorffii]
MPQQASQTAKPLPSPSSSQVPAPSQSPSPAQQQQQQVPHEASQQTQQANAPAGTESSPSSAANQSTEGRKISCEDIQLVQNLIERCLQLYMNQTEVINTLLNQAKIEPGFTSLVWQKLEEQNPDFFKAYYARLKLKKHIMTFNHLLEQQVHLMQKMRIIPTKVPMPHPSNGMHHAMGQVPMGYPVPPLTGDMPAPPMPIVTGGNPLAENFHESPGSSAMDSIMQTGDIPGSGGANGANFPFGGITDMSGMVLDTPFVSHEPHSHEHNSQNGIVSFDGGEEDGHNSRESLGTLGHLPRNFSLSDLAAELGASSDLGALGGYSSPFMSPETESYLQSPDKHDIANCVFSEDDKLLDSLDFGDLK